MPKNSIYKLALNAAYNAGLDVHTFDSLPGKVAEFASPPPELHEAILRHLKSNFPNGLYTHQSKAIASGIAGEDVCLSTSTASGKSLVFMTVAANILLNDSKAKILTLYPAKALIQDQLDKWNGYVAPFGMKINFIDGSVQPGQRANILADSNVLLMTPDVAHAWLMSTLSDNNIDSFVKKIRLLILDEAHVYEGVFGTNMAYFLRRLRIASRDFQIISSTATVGDAQNFIERLTGKAPVWFPPSCDTSATPEKSLIVATNKKFDSLPAVLAELAQHDKCQFLAFGDSRKMVEQVVSVTQRIINGGPDDTEDDLDDTEQHAQEGRCDVGKVLPYRAGYEDDDRKEIQKALTSKRLAGVVSTSAMEFGLDIGEINVVVLLNLPPSMKAFWQRIGRAGRKNPGVCLIIDSPKVITRENVGLTKYLERPIEKSWLYLENRYLQYTNALCAAEEMRENPDRNPNLDPFESLPCTFNKMLNNDLNPTEIIPSDIYPLKQRAQAGPHREFPVRSGIEPNFQVIGPREQRLGNLSFLQVLREAYPGAIYYYMARPYRVVSFKYKKGEIQVRREKQWTTRPMGNAMAFPRFIGGILNCYRSDRGFVSEVEMQVCERVIGFEERRGGAKSAHKYGPNSPFYQSEITRFFETTGVCWFFEEKFTVTEKMARIIRSVYCSKFGIQERDLGFGLFHANTSPMGADKCQGMCIYDSTNGSLRLTELLPSSFSDVIRDAPNHLDADEFGQTTFYDLEAFLNATDGLEYVNFGTSAGEVAHTENDWMVLVASGEKAMHIDDHVTEEVTIVNWRYTPKGLFYELETKVRDIEITNLPL